MKILSKQFFDYEISNKKIQRQKKLVELSTLLQLALGYSRKERKQQSEASTLVGKYAAEVHTCNKVIFSEKLNVVPSCVFDM